MLALSILVAVTIAVFATGNPVSISVANLTSTLATAELEKPPGIAATRCSTVRCAAGTICRVIDGRARCVSVPGPDAPRGATKCGIAICAEGLTCCNASCGVCTRPGMACIQRDCTPSESPKPPEPKPVPCGPAICRVGEECCNESCGYCRAPGESCTEEFCFPPGEGEGAGLGPMCGGRRCQKEMVCCNYSCGLCTPPGASCIARFCG